MSSLAWPYGSKSFTGLAAGKSVSQAFTTRLPSIGATAVTAHATATVDEKAVAADASATAPALNCGAAQ